MDRRLKAFLVTGLVVTALIAAVASGFASGEPDGLEKVALDEGLEATAEDHALDDSPLADYAVDGVGDERLATGVAGVIGAAVTLLATVGLLYAVKRYRGTRSTSG